ncbi:P-loop containing nucleoside triphosphate hydrolase protein [Pisolithus croceorrhizus]|nr:P-loop containing nucleoside triphosphate hydrolase protein [Pisolithus croceorrhizus]KAI6135793.1 P-loop containing nucleoside triphosphate hydrolase protein [Pisolithus croceorrhizus]
MPLNIIVVGETGAGKSSVINLLADRDVASVSSDVDICTKAFAEHKFEVNSTEVCAYDTTGFSSAHVDSSSHLVPYEKAFKLISSLTSKINLILLCTNKNRLNAITQHVYHLFSDFLFDGTVPIALVATHRENDSSMDDWWTRNFQDICESPLCFVGHACVTTQRSRGTSVDIRYQQSRDALIRLLGFATPQGAVTLDISAHPILEKLAHASQILSTKCGLSKKEAELLTSKVKLFLRIPNIVLFGESGVGKSSVINLIAGQAIAAASSEAQGCTLDSTEYRLYANKSHLRIFDTIGLNNPTVEQEGYLDAVKAAYKLIDGLNRAGGVDLLLFCIRRGRFNDAQLNNYRLFHDHLCGKKVPLAIVVTHLEEENEMEQWWTNNEAHIKGLGVECVAHACVTTISRDSKLFEIFEDKVEESWKKLLELLKKNVKELGTPFVMETDVWLTFFLKKMGGFIRGGNFPRHSAIRRMLVEECNIPPKRADAIVAQLRPRLWQKPII